MKARRKQPHLIRRAPDLRKQTDNLLEAPTVISTKRLSEWSRQLLERGLKAYEKLERIHLELSRKCTNSC